jgi:hypothetical protein
MFNAPKSKIDKINKNNNNKVPEKKFIWMKVVSIFFVGYQCGRYVEDLVRSKPWEARDKVSRAYKVSLVGKDRWCISERQLIKHGLLSWWCHYSTSVRRREPWSHINIRFNFSP